MAPLDDTDDLGLIPVERLSKDLREAAIKMSEDEVRYLVDAYYATQNQRIRYANQVRALSESDEPNLMVEWLFRQSRIFEDQIKHALGGFSEQHPVGAWMRAQVGIGPVIAAGFLAHININRCPTYGNLWSYAGLSNDSVWIGGAKAEKAVMAFVGENKTLDPEAVVNIARSLGASPKWLARRIYRDVTEKDVPFKGWPGEVPDHQYVSDRLEGLTVKVKNVVNAISKRPWNATVKVLCYKTGESFVKNQNRDGCEYGLVYRERKSLEEARNATGKYADEAARILKAKNFRKSTDAYKALSDGRLPQAQIHARARRYAVKIFLAHLHQVWYRHAFDKEPPQPYSIAHLGHSGFHDIPKLP